jgi:HD-GYP domain-containing protein (c-di-GMP phosphodiesterase class II)
MTTQRVYNTSKSFAAALVELRRGAGQQFDPHAVDAFAAIPQQRLLGEIEAMTGSMLPPSRGTLGIPLDDR